MPGTCARPVDPLGVFRDLVGRVFQCPTSLGCFAKSFLRKAQSGIAAGKTPGSHPATWPMPLPFPEVLRGNPWTIAPAELKQLIVNVQVILLNYLDLGRPRVAPASCLGPRPLSAAQSEIVARLESFLDAWFTLGTLGPEDMGRTAGKIEDLEAVLSKLASLVDGASPDCAKTGTLGHLKGAKVSSFKPVEAGRLKFRGLPNFDPRPYLDPLSLYIYEHPMASSMDPGEFEGVVPKVRVHCSRTEKIKLFDLLDQSKRIRLFEPSQVREGFGSGVFAVLKSLELDRLILDSRPHNVLETTPNRYIYTLGSSEVLAQLHLSEGENLYLSSNDIRDFYHLFKVSQERARRNILVGTVAPSEVSHLSCFENHLFRHPRLCVGLACLAMGDTQAVELAQTCHLGLCLQNSIISAETLLAMSLPPPRSKVGCGLVIDDFVSYAIESRCPEEVLASPTRAAVLADEAHAAYTRVQLIPHEDKAVRDSLRCEMWGVLIEGDVGFVRGSLRRAAPLCTIILTILKIGAATTGLLEIVAGGLIALFILRRRLMSLLHEIFAATRGREQDEAFWLSNKLKEELTMLVGLVPTAVVELRTAYSEKAYMVDASNWGEAVTSCQIGCLFSKELCRHSLRKGIWTHLLSPARARERGHGTLDPAFEVPGGEADCFRAHPIWTTLAKAGRFKLEYSKAARSRRHINIGELRSYLKAERLAKVPGKATRACVGGDSQVTLGAVLKGRSASAALNQEMQKSLPHVIGSGLYSFSMYCPTSINPADGPTRGRDVPSPLEELPDWWESALTGKFEGMDAWLKGLGCDPFTLSGLPPLENLSKAAEREVQMQLGKKYLTKLKQIRTGRQECQAPELEPPSQNTDFMCKLLNAKGQLVLPAGRVKGDCVGRPGYLDLFSGTGGVARELARLSGRWVLSYEIKNGLDQDLLDKLVQKEIFGLLDAGAFVGIGAAPSCASMSRAVAPAVRTHAFPEGLPHLTPAQDKKVKEGNEFARFVGKLGIHAQRLAIPFWIENPSCSFLWMQPEMITVQGLPFVGFWVFDCCVFGTAWRKRTRVLTNTGLACQKTFCRGCKRHQVLRGRSKYQRCSWTKVAEPYPKTLSLVIAMALTGAAGDRKEFENLDAASCARALQKDAKAPHCC